MKANWTTIETEYREGVKTLVEIAKGQRLTEGAIRAAAKKKGWGPRPGQIVAKQEIQPPITPKITPIVTPEPAPELQYNEPDHQLDGHLEVNQRQMAAIAGVTTHTIINWMIDGLPHTKDSTWTRYRLVEAIAWMKENKWMPNADHKARKIKAEADMAEMDASAQAGVLTKAKEAQAEWEDFLSRLKANLRGFPDRIIPRLEEGGTPAERLAICRKEMDDTLRSVVTEQKKAASRFPQEPVDE